MKKKEISFRRSVVLVALIHLGFLALIICLIKPPKKTGDQVTWLETGSFGAAAAGEESATAKQEDSKEEETPAAASTPEKISTLEPAVEAQPEPKSEPTPEPP